MTLQIELDTQRKELEQRISEVEHELYRMKRRRNTYLPVSRIPSELLVRIFSLTLEETPSEETPSYAHGHPAVLLQRYTRVCGYWREVAIENAALWKYIFMAWPSYSEVALERSKNTPLTVVVGELNLSSRIDVKIWNLILGQIHRLRVIYAGLNERYSQLFEASHVAQSANLAQLQSLKLRYHLRGEAVDTNPLWWISQSTPPDLRELDIDYLPLGSYNITLPSSLTRLSISHHNPALRASRALAILRELPRLEELELAHTNRLRLDGEDVLPLDGRCAVHLPVLKLLVIREPPRSCAELISNLSIPVDAKVHLIFDFLGYHWSTFNTAEFLDHFTTLVAKMSGGVYYRALAITPSYMPDDVGLKHRFHDFAIWTSISSIHLRKPLSLPTIQLSILSRNPEFNHYPGNIPDVILNCIDCTNIEYLVLAEEGNVRVPERSGALSDLCNVTTLHAIDVDNGRLFGLLRNARAERGQSTGNLEPPVKATTETQLLFPRLRCLKVDWRHSNITRNIGIRFSESLSLVLKEREALGQKLQHLDFYGFNQPSSDGMKFLEGTAQEIAVHGHQKPRWLEGVLLTDDYRFGWR